MIKEVEASRITAHVTYTDYGRICISISKLGNKSFGICNHSLLYHCLDRDLCYIVHAVYTISLICDTALHPYHVQPRSRK